MDAFVSADGDGIGRMVGRLAMEDQVAELRQLSQRIEAGNDVFTSWAVNNGGEVIGSGGDEVRIKLPTGALGELPSIRERYAKAVGAPVSVGVGMSLSESNKALIAAKLTGKDRTVFYSKDVDRVIAENKKQETEGEKLSDQYLNKAEQPQHHPPHRDSKDHDPTAEAQKQADDGPGVEAPPAQDDHEAHFHQAAQEQEKKDKAPAQQGDDKLKAQVAQVLQAVKQQAPVMEQIKQSAPDTYNAVMGMVQSIIAMAKRISGAPVQKSEPYFTPAFRRHNDNELVVTPGFHDASAVIDQHGGDYEDVERDWETGFVDPKGEFYSRRDAAAKVYAGKSWKLAAKGTGQVHNYDTKELESGDYAHGVKHGILKSSKDYEAETKSIKRNRETVGAEPHDFKAAQWTHPNGHPRCIKCGDEEREGGKCEGYKLDKADLPATRHNLQLPVGSKKDPSGTGTREAGKVKVRHSDVESGAPGKEAWLSMRAGMVMSNEGHPISAKNPNGK